MLDKVKNFYYRHLSDGIHTFKYVLAFLIGYAVMQLFPEGRSQWIMITIAVVMGSQAIVGLQVNKSILRILGTLVGAVLGMVALTLPSNHYMVVGMLIAAALFFATLSSKESDFSYVATLGMGTFTLVALTTPPSYELAGLRILDILIGVMISLAVSRFVFPLSSRRAFALTAKTSFDQLGKLIAMMFVEQRERRNDPDLLELDAKIGGTIAKLRLIIKALRYESIRKNKSREDLLQVLRYFRAIYRYNLFMDSVLTENRQQDPKATEQWLSSITTFSQALIDLLNDFETDKSFDAEKEVVAKLKQTGHDFCQRFPTMPLNDKSAMRAQAIVFAIHHIILCCEKLTLTWNTIVTK